MRIAGICGSLRRDSWNRKLLSVAMRSLDDMGERIEIIELSRLPVFNQDLELEMPEPVVALRETIVAADAIVIASPEHNNSLPSALKNAIDWASRPPNALGKKVAAIMGASVGMFGTKVMQTHLRHILSILDVLVIPTPQITVARAHEMFDAEGRLLDEALRAQIGSLLARMISVTQKLSNDAR